MPETAPMLFGPPPPPNVKNDVSNVVNVTVQGGTTNAETDRAVGGAVRGALPQDDYNGALAAVGSNGY